MTDLPVPPPTCCTLRLTSLRVCFYTLTRLLRCSHSHLKKPRMASKMGVSTLVVGMFITGCANSLL